MAKLRQLIKECPTARNIENMQRDFHHEQKEKIKETNSLIHKILNEDITHVPREASVSNLSKDALKKKYPGFSD